MKKKIVLGFVISLVFLLYILSTINYGEILVALKSAQYSLLFLGIILTMVALLLRSLRWKYLLKPVCVVPLLRLYSVTSIGAMTDMIVPARPGDLVRAYLIGEKASISKLSSLATIVVERFLDILNVLLILVIVLIPLSNQDGNVKFVRNLQIGGYFFAMLALLILILLILVNYREEKLKKYLGIFLRILPAHWKWKNRIDDYLNSFAMGLATIRKGKNIIAIISLSFLLWTTYAFINLIVLRSFGLNFTFMSALYFLIFQAVGVSIPSSPGYIGTYHASVMIGFTIFMVSKELALSVAIMMHAIFFSLPFF